MTRNLLEVLHVTREMQALDPIRAPAQALVMSEPMIKIGFHHREPGFNAETMVQYSECLALIDTGADGVYVDPSLIKEHGCPVAEGNSDLTINGEKSGIAYKASLFIIEQSRSIEMWVGSSPFDHKVMRFQIILGRRFLQFCDLRWNGPDRIVSLQMLDNPSAY